MTGTIMIVDPLATNRIVLKVKLSAAFYTVTQAESGAEAAARARLDRPDLLLVSDNLPDMSTEALLRALGRPGGDSMPAVVVLMTAADTDRRVSALQAGAADVIRKPFAESALLARLRRILRQRHMNAELRMHADTAAALGFAEAPATFDGPARIAILADRPDRSQDTLARLQPFCLHQLSAAGYEPPGTIDGPQHRQDLFVVRIGADQTDAGLSLVAELQASPQTRHARVVALLDPQAEHLIGPVLDMGAHDAVAGGVSDREIAMRLSLQLEQKRRDDAMRETLASGLHAAVVDPLTGLYNRRYALTYLKRLSASAARDERTFAVMLADLDHFKTVNDRFGHAAGDAVLAQIGRRMQGALPSEEMIARIGGEEFLIAVPDTSLSQARSLADRICALVREHPVALPGASGQVSVTVSIGVALAAPCNRPEPADIEALIGQADGALYGAKSGGRNTVTFCRRPAA